MFSLIGILNSQRPKSFFHYLADSCSSFLTASIKQNSDVVIRRLYSRQNWYNKYECIYYRFGTGGRCCILARETLRFHSLAGSTAHCCVKGRH